MCLTVFFAVQLRRVFVIATAVSWIFKVKYGCDQQAIVLNLNSQSVSTT